MQFMLILFTLIFAAEGPDLAEQKAALEKELAQTKKPGEIHLQLSELLEKMGDLEGSVGQAEKALTFLADQAPAHFRLAVAMRGQMTKNPMSWMTGKDAYLKHLEQAIQLDKDFLPAYQEIVGFHLNAPAFIGASKDQAQAVAEKLAGHMPKQGTLLIAQVLQKKGEVEKAIELLQTMLAEMPSDGDLNHALGGLLSNEKRYSEAYASFDKNIQSPSPKLISMYHAARNRILGQIDLEAALPILDRYIQLVEPGQSPTKADAFWQKGVAYVLLKNEDQARASFKRALALDADHKEAIAFLAKLGN